MPLPVLCQVRHNRYPKTFCHVKDLAHQRKSVGMYPGRCHTISTSPSFKFSPVMMSFFGLRHQRQNLPDHSSSSKVLDVCRLAADQSTAGLLTAFGYTADDGCGLSDNFATSNVSKKKSGFKPLRILHATSLTHMATALPPMASCLSIRNA